ncbi:hypothetical protein Tco_0481819 [Tanacetum coccineum]
MSLTRSSRRNRSLVVIVQDDTPTMQPLDKADIPIQKHIPFRIQVPDGSKETFDKMNENHIPGPSTVAIAKKFKELIQKDELTIADLEGAVLERLKVFEGYDPRRWSRRRRTVIKNRVEDIQLGVESYQRSLNLTKPTMFFKGIDQRIPFTMTATHKGVVKLSEVKKFCNGTLVKIQENLIDMLSKNKLGSSNKRHREQLRRLEEYVRGRPETVNPVKGSILTPCKAGGPFLSLVEPEPASYLRSTYARALIEILADVDLMDSLVIAIPRCDKEGHTFATIDIEYEWTPPSKKEEGES